MTQEQILKLKLTPEERERVIASFEVSERMHKESPLLSLTTETDVRKKIGEMIKAYNKRKEAEARKRAKEQAKQEQLNKVAEMMALAEKEKIELNIDDIENTFNEKYNARIDEQIALLEGKKRPIKKKK